MKRWEPGVKRHGWEICDAVKSEMWEKSHRRPLECTIMRRLRDHRWKYGVVSVRRTSVYVKVEPKEEEVKA